MKWKIAFDNIHAQIKAGPQLISKTKRKVLIVLHGLGICLLQSGLQLVDGLRSFRARKGSPLQLLPEPSAACSLGSRVV